MQLKSLKELFNNCIFRIPDYQRGYAWGPPELQDFWDDLVRLSPERSHYTGQVTLEAVPENRWKQWGNEERWLIQDGWKPFHVVDGQQRLTTAIILIKAILERVPRNRELGAESRADLEKRYLFRTQRVVTCPIFGYEKDNPSHEFFRARILGLRSSQGDDVQTKYTSNLLAAHRFFTERLKKMKPAEVESLFRTLTNRFRFNEYLLDDDFDVFVAFETMNNRGKQLSKLELLKNRLIYLSTRLSAEEEERQQIRVNITEAWKTIYHYLGMDPESALDDDAFLRAHWILFFEYDRSNAGEFHRFLLDRYFTVGAVDAGKLTLEKMQRYVASLQDAVKHWWSIHFPANAGQLPSKVRRAIERMNRLGFGAFEPLLIAAMLREPAEDELVNLVDEMERFVFLASRLAGVRGDTGDSHFYRLAGEVFNKHTSVPAAAGDVSGWTDDHFKMERAVLEMTERFEEGGRGFYDWRELRYLLFEYEQHLRRKSGSNAAKIDWAEFVESKRDHVTVEHIYPQHPKDGDWPEFDELDDDSKHRYRHSLGNLLALSRPKNSELSNQGFAAKRGGKRGYRNGSFSEIDVSTETVWTPQTILARGLKILEFAEFRWRVDLGDEDDKLRLLGLAACATESASD